MTGHKYALVQMLHVYAICWHAVLSMRLLGREPLTPPPPGGLIWGEGRCVLLLVRNNHSRPITFTAARCALTAVRRWALRGGKVCGSDRNHKWTHEGCKVFTNILNVHKHPWKRSKTVKMQILHSGSFGPEQICFKIKLLLCVFP